MMKVIDLNHLKRNNVPMRYRVFLGYLAFMTLSLLNGLASAFWPDYVTYRTATIDFYGTEINQDLFACVIVFLFHIVLPYKS